MNSDLEKQWPFVHAKDPGIVALFDSKKCYYCEREVGELHKSDCVTVTKLIKVNYSFEIEVRVPHYWSKEQIESQYSKGIGCASEALEDLVKYAEDKKECLCGAFKLELVSVVDNWPKRGV